MEKALYIIEFSRTDAENESEWFVADDNIDYDQQEKIGYKHLAENFDEEVQELKKYVTIEAVYRVDDKLIKEVYESKKQ